MGFLQSILAWLLGMGDKLLVIIEGAGNYILDNGGAVLVDAASAAVLAAETTAGTGAEKFAAAEAQVIAVLEKDGIPLVKGAVQTAIQLAYAALPKSVPNATTVATASPAQGTENAATN